ncbi:hypothetical protein D5086_015580 [Populus alba]|uniref:Uncharacterized protein n=1 Tax=Populus alba TaxID=43335 RepID=A0ACC4BRJ4_POPAL
MAFCHEISMKTPLVLAKALLLVLLIFSSAIETGALARTLNSMKPPPPPGAMTSKVYDPNSGRLVPPSSPNCRSYIPGHCGGQRSIINIDGQIDLDHLYAKAMILLALILSSFPTLAFARTSNMMPPFGAHKVYLPQGNRPVAPSSPNGCTYVPTPAGAPGHCGLRH